MPKLATEVVFDPETAKLTVDGEEFPYHVGTDINVAIDAEHSGFHRVSLDLLVDGNVFLWGRKA